MIRKSAMFDLLRVACLLLLIGTVCAPPLPAQDSAISSRRKQTRSEFGARQRLVERKMLELEAQLTVIADRIREKDPKKADRLVEAYQQSREKLITQKMSEVSGQLDQNKLTEAGKTLDEVVENLDLLIRLLINEKDPEVSKKQEIEQLEQFKQQIQEQIARQRDERQELAKISDKEKSLKALDAQIKKLDDLIKKQTDAIKQAEAAKDAGLRALDKVADQQFEIRKQTQDLAKELGQPEGESEQTPQDGKPNEAGDPQSPPSGEAGKPGAGEPKPGQPSKEPGESSDDAGQPGSGKPSEGGGQPKPGESAGDSPKSNQPPQPGQEALEKASDQQQKAEEQLGSGRSQDAQRQQEMALENLEKARKELKKEQRRIESLPPEAIKELADRQRRIRDKAMDVAKQMKDAPKSKPEGEQGDDSQPQQTPGQQKMEEAGDAMQQASGNLQDGENENAQQQQKKAQEKMEQAIDEIEERLNQLREETREEKLARLESRFREMLSRQQVASVMTIELDDKLTNLGPLKRRDQLLLLRVSNDEWEIRELGQQAYDLLLEDGTSIVFPEVLQDLRSDLEQVAGLLSDDRTDRFTQLLQKEIEAAILDLLDSLEEAKQEEKSGGGGGGGGGGDQPLLKKSAELKILRMQQQRLNRRTRRVDQLRETGFAEEKLTGELEKAAKLQTKLLEMTEQLMEKQE